MFSFCVVVAFKDIDDCVSIEEGMIRRPFDDDEFNDDDDDDIDDDDVDEDEAEDGDDEDCFLDGLIPGQEGHQRRGNGKTKNPGGKRTEHNSSEEGEDAQSVVLEPPVTTPYEADPATEVFGDVGDQTEEISDENKSIVWFLVKQVRPGMDLSKVVLPTFILEPRSFLDKISDYYYHADILSE